MDIALVRTRLAEAVSTITGLKTFSYVPDSMPEPAFMVGEVEIEFDRTFGRGQDEMTVTCRVLVSRADDRSGQSKLDGYLAGSGLLSIKAALEAARGAPGSPALGGACDDFRVERVLGYQVYTVGDARYYGADFIVRVIGSGS